MADSRLVCHEGIVVGIGTTDRSVQVKILPQSMCAQCHARGMCTALEMKEKIIDVVLVSRNPIQIGDRVVVMMEEKLGMKAIFFGFFLPLIVMIISLFFSMPWAAAKPELLSMVLAVCCHTIYCSIFSGGSLRKILYLKQKKNEL